MMDSQIFKRFIKRRTSMIGGIILIVFFIMATIGPFMCPYSPTETNSKLKYQSPSAEHLLGTDNLGRDILTRLVHGARVTLMISLIGVLSGSVVGIMLGVLAGYYGRWTDAVISRFLELLMAFPGLLLAIFIIAILGNGVVNTMGAVAIFSVPTIARMVRGIVITIKGSEYVQACRVMGESDARIIMTHIIPNSMSQIIVNVTLNFGSAILTASSLSFLGLGVQPPNPEWGAMLNQGKEVIRSFPIAALVPGIAITLVVLSFSMVGDGLRDALDPKLKNS